MGKRKCIGIIISVLVALLAGPALSAAAGPERINESFVMGDTGCQMNIVLDGTGGIVSADLGPAFEPPPPPPPTTYSFNFTGTVASTIVNGGTVPAEITTGTPFDGTLTYAPSTFLCGVPGTDSLSCGNDPSGSSVAILSVTFRPTGVSPQSFHTNTVWTSDVFDNRVLGSTLVDMYEFTSFSMVSNPSLGVVNSVLALRDDTGAALTGLEYPTNLSWSSWTTHRILQVFVPGGSSPPWQINGTLDTLAPAPPSGVIISAAASPAVQQSAAVPEWCTDILPVEDISSTFVCKDCSDNGDGTFNCTQATCETKTAVEQNIMEKSGDGSTYCYYTKTGQRTCKTI